MVFNMDILQKRLTSEVTHTSLPHKPAYSKTNHFLPHSCFKSQYITEDNLKEYMP